MKQLIGKIQNSRKAYFIIYTLLFAAVAMVAFSYFYLQGKTFISTVDGYFQYYKALIYYRRYLTGIVSDLLSKHQLIIPQWDFHMGEGNDILSALYYTIGDPIAALVAFVPEKHIYLFYDLSIIFRIYLSGLMFSWLCFYVNKGTFISKLAGTITYDFCYWMLLSQSKDIYFLNPTIYMPMVILGVEKILKERKPMLFAISVFLSAISNFYFFFMIAILTVIYVAVRLILAYGKDMKKILITVLYIGVYALLGTGLAAVTAMPVAYALLSNNRLGLEYGVHAFYPLIYYERFLNILLSKDDPYWLCMGFASPCLLSLALSFRQFKKDKLVFFLNLITMIMICVPYFGKVLNGFSYISNRWSFAIALVYAYTLTVKWDEFKDHKLYLIIVVFLCFGWAVAFPNSRDVRIFIPLCICLFFMLMTDLDGQLKLFGLDLKELVLLGLVILSVLYNADYTYSYRGRKRTDVVISKQLAQSILTDSEAYAIKENVKDPDFFRYSGSNLTHNIAILNETDTTSYYFSISNPNVTNYRNKLGVNEYLNFMYKEYDQRSILHTLANVRYYITDDDYNGMIPYGFEFEKGFDSYRLYRNSNDLPFGYTYSSSISQSKWDELNAVEKQEAMTEAVVTKDGKDEISLASRSLNYRLEAVEDAQIEENCFIAKKDGAAIRIFFEGLPQSEYYLLVEGLEFDDGYSYYEDKGTDALISVSLKDQEKQIEYHTSDYQFYNGKDSYAVNLGYQEQIEGQIELAFENAGTYSFDKLEVVCMPVKNLSSDLEKLKEVSLKEYEFDVNTIRGSIDLNEERYLVLSVPYSQGWKAYVDGNEADLLKANEAYMALKLDKGSHTIELKYETPLLKTGTAVSVISFIVLIAISVIEKKHFRG